MLLLLLTITFIHNNRVYVQEYIYSHLTVYFLLLASPSETAAYSLREKAKICRI